MSKTKVGILGFGNLGQYLTKQILTNAAICDKFELVFVQNRTVDKIKAAKLPLNKVQIMAADLLSDLNSFLEKGHTVDVIVEASHPEVIRKHGVELIQHASLFITSLTALADDTLYSSLKENAINKGKQLFIPVGAGWGFSDIKKMADADTLQAAQIEMEFHADALKLNEPLKSKLLDFVNDSSQKRIKLYEGTVEGLADLAPNNTNTMCGLALAAHNLGFKEVVGKLIATKTDHKHKVRIAIEGPAGFSVSTERINPAQAKAVTGSLTFNSFLASLMDVRFNKTSGMKFV